MAQVSRLRGRELGCLGLLLLMSPSGWAALGTVYADLNANGVRDGAEPGVANVRISDGLQVTTTDDAGNWQLDIDGDAVIFLVKPTGYATPTTPGQIPQFYYIHQPDGSPEGLKYPGIEPTGPLPQSIDFALLPQDEPAVFEALLFADTQPQTEVELDYIRDRVVAELIGTPAKFGMTMGDIMFDDLSLFPRLIDINVATRRYEP